jgi:hypothetical protein
MENKDKQYEVIINNAVNILKAFSLVSLICIVTIVIINNYYNIPKVWNISFLIPIFSVYFASVIELIICFWKTGKAKNIEKLCNRKSNLIFSSCITYIVFLGIFFMYSLLSIILF